MDLLTTLGTLGAKAFGGIMLLIGTTLITVPQWGSATLIEAVWTGVGVAMIAFSLWALPRIVGDWVLTLRIPGHYSDARTLLAKGHVKREVLRTAQGIIVFTIGIYAMLTANPVPGPAQITLAGVVLTSGLIALGALTAVQTLLDHRQRALAEAIMRRDDENGDDHDLDHTDVDTQR